MYILPKKVNANKGSPSASQLEKVKLPNKESPSHSQLEKVKLPNEETKTFSHSLTLKNDICFLREENYIKYMKFYHKHFKDAYKQGQGVD